MIRIQPDDTGSTCYLQSTKMIHRERRFSVLKHLGGSISLLRDNVGVEIRLRGSC